jgi:purine-binding chemotaxis protein CheW
MSKEGKRDKKPKKSKLPRSGLAEEILDRPEYAEPKPYPPPVNEEDAAGAETPEGPDRLYEFADIMSETKDDDGEKAKTKEKAETWVTFGLAGETFALPVSHVQEILRVKTITKVPHAPDPVRGVTNKRGQVLPVVDLRRRLGVTQIEPGPKSRILVVESRKRLLGLLVDEVHKVVRIVPSQVQAPPSDVLTEQSDYILGVTNLDENLVILLEVDRVLTIKEPVPAVAG